MRTLFFLAAFALRATTIYLASDELTTTNSSGHATVDLAGALRPNSAWAAPLAGSRWISYGPTGDHDDPGYFTVPNGNVVVFITQFILAGPITGGNLTVLADDSTSVILNGHLLIAAFTHPGSRCSDVPAGCLVSTEAKFTFADLSPYLVDGVNSFSFGVAQVNGSSFGLDFSGKVIDAPTPEPATLASLACGLLGLAGWWRHREFRPRASGNLRVDARKFSPV